MPLRCNPAQEFRIRTFTSTSLIFLYCFTQLFILFLLICLIFRIQIIAINFNNNKFISLAQSIFYHSSIIVYWRCWKLFSLCADYGPGMVNRSTWPRHECFMSNKIDIAIYSSLLNFLSETNNTNFFWFCLIQANKNVI